MDAKAFNAQVDLILRPKMERSGFRMIKACFIRQDDFGQLVLLRYGGSKYSSACQFTRFMLCFRHSFLRDVWENLPAPMTILDQVSSYPFRIKPSDLSAPTALDWRYHFKLNPDEYDQVDYGQMATAEGLLDEMADNVRTHGLAWASRLTPETGLLKIVAENSGAFVDRLWIADYQNRNGARTTT
jgi:hypothetical protein